MERLAELLQAYLDGLVALEAVYEAIDDLSPEELATFTEWAKQNS